MLGRAYALLLRRPGAAVVYISHRKSYKCQPLLLPANSSTTAAAAAATAAAATANSAEANTLGGLGTSLPNPSKSLQKRAVGKLLPPLPGSMNEGQQPPLSLEDTLQAVAVPPLLRNLGPRVEHVQVSAAGLLSEAVASALQLPHAFVLELIRFGAVHYCPVMLQPSPKAAPRMCPQHLERMQQLRAAGIARHGKNPKLQVPRRITADCPVEEGGYVRVHVHPKRFPAAYSVDWRQCVLADRPEYVVVDKPAGVQVPPTVDNLLENVVSLTASALGLPPDALANTHRLDVGTSGVVVLAKGAAFAAWFSSLLKNKPGALVKTYRCLTATPPPLGPMVHWAVVKQRGAGEPAHTRMLCQCAAPDATHSSSSSSRGRQEGEEEGGLQAPAGVEGAVRCELIVEQVVRVTLTGAAAAEWGAEAYETTLQLVTGRTHQIRAQMAAVGCPLLGDQLYTALAARWQQEQPQPQPQPQPQRNGGQAQHRHAGAQWSKVYQEDPSRPIGLQAANLRVSNVCGRMTAAAAAGDGGAGGAGGGGGAEEVLGEEGADSRPADQPEWVEFEAGTPWWRAGC